MKDRRRFAIHMFDRYSSVFLTYECAPCMPSEVRRKGLVWKHGVCDFGSDYDVDAMLIKRFVDFQFRFRKKTS